METRQYRGIRIDNGKWATGWYFETGLGVSMITMDGFSFELDKSTVGQSTGLKDKNGAEGFKGDRWQHPSSQIFIIEWNENIARFVLNMNGHHISVEDFKDGEIIGSIHDKEKQ